MEKKWIVSILIVAVLIIAVFIGVTYQNSNPVTTKAEPLAVDTNATAESVASLSSLMNNFSFNIYQRLSSNEDENIFFSPYSIFVALAMTYEGAKGDTANEMYDVLGFPQNDDISLCSFGRIYNEFNQKKEYTLNTANALWIKKGYEFLSQYLTFINDYYMGRATEVDFSNPVNAAALINDWIKENTGGKIKDLIKESDIHEALTMILTNAIYFKGLWANQFDPEDTNDRDFKLSSGSTISVPTMSLSDDDTSWNYTETDDLQILELPYKGGKLSMYILLPKENNITALEEMINYENFTEWKNSLYKAQVEVFLPKFKLETEYSIKDHLKNMGMNIPFTPNADFSGMDGKQDLFIEKVRHKAFIEVNEEGTEAAAATSVHMALTALPMFTEFNCNHPFIFLIQHKDTDVILFMGKVENPQ